MHYLVLVGEVGGGIFGHVMRSDQSCTSKNKCLIFSHDSVRLFVLMQNRLAQLALVFQRDAYKKEPITKG